MELKKENLAKALTILEAIWKEGEISWMTYMFDTPGININRDIEDIIKKAKEELEQI